MLGYTRDATHQNQLKTAYSGFKLPTVLGSYGQNLATTQQINKTLKEWQNVGYMARVNYNYANKYYLTANFRRDGFSGFARVVNGLTFQVYLLLGHCLRKILCRM